MKFKSTPRSRLGLSLIELTVALVLSSMMMAVLLSIVGQMSRSQARIKSKFELSPWQANLQLQMQADYRRCHSVLVEPKSIRFKGQYSYQDAEGMWREGPIYIRYVVFTDKEANWLFRIEKNVITNESSHELVCVDVVGFRSLDRLSTDIAPGVLRVDIELSGDEDSDASPDLNAAESQQLRLTLVRHGGIES